MRADVLPVCSACPFLRAFTCTAVAISGCSLLSWGYPLGYHCRAATGGHSSCPGSMGGCSPGAYGGKQPECLKRPFAKPFIPPHQITTPPTPRITVRSDGLFPIRRELQEASEVRGAGRRRGTRGTGAGWGAGAGDQPCCWCFWGSTDTW